MIARFAPAFVVAILLCITAFVTAQARPDRAVEPEVQPEITVDVAQPSVSPPLRDLANAPPTTKPMPENRPPENKAIHEFIIKEVKEGHLPAELIRPAEFEDMALAAQFPARRFYLLGIPMYPVAREVPPPLASRNIFALDKENNVTHITDVAGLKALFIVELPARKTDAELKQAAAAWLLLSQELANDGMYRFSISDEDTKIAAKDAGKIVTGLAKVTAGARGGGGITAQLTFDKGGKLTDVSETHELNPGIRPICQGTKLLDADPVVRGMAERDLLVMGPACKFYLADQWRKADAKLRVEIERVWGQIVSEAGLRPENNPLP